MRVDQPLPDGDQRLHCARRKLAKSTAGSAIKCRCAERVPAGARGVTFGVEGLGGDGEGRRRGEEEDDGEEGEEGQAAGGGHRERRGNGNDGRGRGARAGRRRKKSESWVGRGGRRQGIEWWLWWRRFFSCHARGKGEGKGKKARPRPGRGGLQFCMPTHPFAVAPLGDSDRGEMIMDAMEEP